MKHAGRLHAEALRGLLGLLRAHPHLGWSIRTASLVAFFDPVTSPDLLSIQELFSRPLGLAHLTLAIGFDHLVALADALECGGAAVQIAGFNLALESVTAKTPYEAATAAYARLLAAIAPHLYELGLNLLDVRADEAALPAGVALGRLPRLRRFAPKMVLPIDIACVIRAADGPLELVGELTDDLVLALSPIDRRKIREAYLGHNDYFVWLTPAGWAQLTDLRQLRITPHVDLLWSCADLAALPPSLVSLRIGLAEESGNEQLCQDEEGQLSHQIVANWLDDRSWLPRLAELDISAPTGEGEDDRVEFGVMALREICVQRRIALTFDGRSGAELNGCAARDDD